MKKQLDRIESKLDELLGSIIVTNQRTSSIKYDLEDIKERILKPYTSSEAADYLGFSRKYFREKISPKMPSVKVGRKRLFKKSDLDEFKKQA